MSPLAGLTIVMSRGSRGIAATTAAESFGNVDVVVNSAVALNLSCTKTSPARRSD